MSLDLSRLWTWMNGLFNRPRQQRVHRGWLSWQLQWWWLTLVGLVNVGFICTMVVLACKSKTNDGIATVSLVPIQSLSDFSFPRLGNSQLRWTLVPALIMALLLLAFDSIIAAVAARQPFVELRNAGHARKSMRMTLMLDYMSYPLFYVWAIALRNGHVILGFAMLFRLLASISLVSLAASVFQASVSQSTLNMSVSFTQEFSIDLLDSRTDMQPALDLANAIHVHSATAPSWMNVTHAFEPFELDRQDISGNLTTSTFALSSVPDCRIIDSSEYRVAFEATNGDESANLNFIDRGCNVTGNMALTSSTPVYALSWYQQCRGEQYDRIGLYLGLYNDNSPTKLQNLTIVSCMPTYWNSTASLTVATSSSSTNEPVFVSAKVGNAQEVDLLAWDQIHRLLEYYQFYDPSATFKADLFGKTVYKYAQILSPASTLDAPSVKTAAETVYSTMFAALAATSLRRPRILPRVGSALVSRTVTRLYVDETVAWALVAVLVALLLGTVGSLYIVSTTTSMLREEPKGLLCYARLLQDSDALSVVQDFRQRHPQVYEMREYINKHYRASVADATCFYDEQENRIRIQGGVLQLYRTPQPKVGSGYWAKQKLRAIKNRSRGDWVKQKLKAVKSRGRGASGKIRQLGHLRRRKLKPVP